MLLKRKLDLEVDVGRVQHGVGTHKHQRLAAANRTPERSAQSITVGQLLLVKKTGEVDVLEFLVQGLRVGLPVRVRVGDEYVVAEEELGEPIQHRETHAAGAYPSR